MFLISDNTALLRFVPHSIKPVAGESSLFDKIEVHLQAAEDWIAQHFIDSELLEDLDSLDPALVLQLQRLESAVALIYAIPSLDLVLTPNGFGVVSTNTVAAASKPRIDRLIESLRTMRDSAIIRVVDLLPQVQTWLDSHQARFFASSLFCSPELVQWLGDYSSDIWEHFLELRIKAIDIEDSLAREYFSPELVSELRFLNLSGSLTSLQRMVVKYISAQVFEVIKGKPVDDRKMRDVVNLIRNHPGTFRLWHSSATARLFDPPVFENKKSAKGYFF